MRRSQQPRLSDASEPTFAAGRFWSVLRALLGLIALCVPLHGAAAQDPTIVQQKQQSSFPQAKGGILGGSPKKIDKSQPLYLQADELIYDTKNNRVIAKGNVEVYYNNYVLTADKVTYDQNANTMEAEGNAKLREPNGNVVSGQKLVATDDFRDAFVQSLSIVTKDETRIAARRLVRKDGNVSEFEQGKFTPCKNSEGMPPLWCISASRIVHDQQAGSISYQDAQFEIFGQPVVYLPYFEHGDPSVKRRTGFLMPEMHQSTTLGFGMEVPYYFALSPYYDFTFHPTYWSKHGVLWAGDWRQRVAIGDVKGEYSIKVAGINQDASTLPVDLVPVDRRHLYDGWRGSVETKGNFSLSSWWKFGWDVTVESDDAFRRFYKLDGVLQVDRVNQVWLQGLSDRNYFAVKLYHFGGLLIQDTPATQSYVLPVIDYRYIADQPVLGGELAFNSNAVSLTRADGTDVSRVSAEASWRRKIVDPIGQVWSPYLSVRGDLGAYSNAFDPDTQASLPADSFARASATAALTYAYPWIYHGATASHTIEPIGQIVARPTSIYQQRALPDEDARSIVWSDALLFDVNKFSGWDRIETGTRVNVGGQYTFQSNSGGSMRVIAGQSIQLAGDNAFADPGIVPGALSVNGTCAVGTPYANGYCPVYNFSPTSGLQTKHSDYVLGAYISPISAFKVVAQSRFDENDLSLRRQDLFSAISLGPVHLSAQYSYLKNDPVSGLVTTSQQVITQATLKLTDRWSITGLLRYDIENDFRLMDGIVLKYADECFVLTAQYTETFINNPELYLKPDRSIMLRFEWKYLGEYRYSANGIDSMYSQSATKF